MIRASSEAYDVSKGLVLSMHIINRTKTGPVPSAFFLFFSPGRSFLAADELVGGKAVTAYAT